MSMLIEARKMAAWFPIIIAIALSAGCQDASQTAVKKQVNSRKPELTEPQRVARVSKIITRNNPLPSTILDAQFVSDADGEEDELGFGPTDYVHYMYLRVAPGDVEKWNVLLVRKLDYVPSPKNLEKYPWWINAKNIKEFEFFEPYPLAPWDGWVALSRKTGEIWVYGFTT